MGPPTRQATGAAATGESELSARGDMAPTSNHRVASPTPSSSALPRHVLLVAPLVFQICWWLICAMHFFNGTLAFVFATMYLFFSLPAVFPSIAVLKVPLSLLRISGWGYAALSVVHWVALLQMIWRSLRKRRLTFTKPATVSSSSSSSSSRWHCLCATLSAWHRRFWAPYNCVFGIDGLVGVNGAYFHTGFFLREVIEIGLQTYQASQLSSSVRRQWITHLAVVTIVLNTFSGPLVQFLMRKNSESARRFVSLLFDMCLDFCCAAVIPLCVGYPYFAAYDLSIGSFRLELLNDDTWYFASIAEIRQFCVTSTSDLLATMLPHVTVVTCLSIAKKLVQRDDHTVTGTDPSSQGVPMRFKTIVAMGRVTPGKNVKVTSSVASSMVARQGVAVKTPRYHHCVLFLGHMMMGAWAIAVVVLQYQASAHATLSAVPACRLSLNAWFATRTPCAVMQINCHRDQIQGSANEITQAIAPLDRSILKKLIITHCPALEVPPLLVEFNALTDLDLYNSTLKAWPMEAAATPTALMSLASFNWLASPYIDFPAGLLHGNLPKAFTRLSIAKSNLTELPDDLGSIWASQYLDLFSIQFTPLRRLPHSFQQLRVHKIRLISCDKLTEISADALATKRLTVLDLSGTPIASWPSSIGDTSALVSVFAEHTDIRNVSRQLNQWWATRPQSQFARFLFSLYGSPICSGLGDAPVAVCATNHGAAQGNNKWDLIEAQRPL